MTAGTLPDSAARRPRLDLSDAAYSMSRERVVAVIEQMVDRADANTDEMIAASNCEGDSDAQRDVNRIRAKARADTWDQAALLLAGALCETPNDTTPEAIALRLVGAGDAALLVEGRRLVVKGIREDRRSRATNEGVLEVLRDVKEKIAGLADEQTTAGSEAGDRHDGAGADAANYRAEGLYGAEDVVDCAIKALGGVVASAPDEAS